MIRKFIVLTFLLIYGISLRSFSQEFDLNVEVAFSPQFSSNDQVYLDGLKNVIESYIGNYRRSDDATFINNKIKLTMQLIVETRSTNTYSGSLFVQASRKIYNNDKETSLFRFQDKQIKFDYNKGEVLQFNEKNFSSLSSIFDYYIYLILGYDADSYEPMAGNIYFLRASKISTLPGNSGYDGWSASATNTFSRKVMIDEFLDTKFQNMRNGYFKYHYDGLDLLAYDQNLAYQGMLDGLKLINEADLKYPNSQFKRRFFEAKSKEITEFFKNAPSFMRQDVYAILKRVDPSNLKDYDELR